MTKSEEHELLMGILERNRYHPRCRCEYILENGVRKSRVVRDIFFMSDEQIRLTRRFVSRFIYETNATFNINTLRLLLSIIVGIDNTSSTFLMAFMFMTSESAKAFKFTSDQLTDLVFYDCPQPCIICGDFSKRLGAAITLKAKADVLLVADEDSFVHLEDNKTLVSLEVTGEFLDSDTIVVDIRVGIDRARTLL